MKSRSFLLGWTFRLAAYVVAICSVFGAEAQEHPGDRDDLMDKYRYVIQHALDETKRIGQPCYDCGITMAGKSEPEPPSMSPSCQATYKSLYDKPVVDMRLVLGYLDYKNDVEDRYQAAAMIEEITKPCDGSTNTCGFKPVEDDGELFEKHFFGADGKWRTVRLTIVNSSARDSEKLNRGEFKQAQDRKTRRAEEAFYGGLNSADVLLYAGHARAGGGPDFGPPRLNSGRTDLNWYRQNREQSSWGRLKRAISSSTKKPQILGLFGCDTEKHFGRELRQSMPGSGVITIDGPKSWFTTALAHAFTTIDSVLNTRCEDDFKRALATVKDIDGEPASPIRFDGYFRGGGAVAGGGASGFPPRSAPSVPTGGAPYPNPIRGGTNPGSYPLPALPMTPVDPKAPAFNSYDIY